MADPNVCFVGAGHIFDSLNPFTMPCLSDQSVAVLHELFGNAVNYFVGSSPSSLGPLGGSGNNDFLIPLVLQHFNTMFCSLVILIYAFVVGIGTINTAHEGQFLGKNWSSFWTIARLVGGTGCLIPSKLYGLCAAQFVVLYFLLIGVNMATSVWAHSLSDIEVGVAPTTPTSMYGMINDAVGHSFVSTAVNHILNPTSDSSNATTNNTIKLASQYVPLDQIGDQNLYNDIEQGMDNLCRATFLVVPANMPGFQGITLPGPVTTADSDFVTSLPNSTAAGATPIHSAGVFLTNAGALPADERQALNGCLANVNQLFDQTSYGHLGGSRYYNETTTPVIYAPPPAAVGTGAICEGSSCGTAMYPSQWFAWIGAPTGTSNSVMPGGDAFPYLAIYDGPSDYEQPEISWPDGGSASDDAEPAYRYRDGRTLYEGFSVPTVASGIYFDGSSDGRSIDGAPSIDNALPAYSPCAAGTICNNIMISMLGQVDNGQGTLQPASSGATAGMSGTLFVPAYQSASGEVNIKGTAIYNPGKPPLNANNQPDPTGQLLINDLNAYAGMVNSGPGASAQGPITYQLPGSSNSVTITPVDCTAYIGTPAAQLPASASACSFTALSQVLAQQVMSTQTESTCQIASNTQINPGNPNASATPQSDPSCPLISSVATTPAHADDVDLQMNSSWYYAGEVYLELDQILAQNLSNLYAQFQGLNNSSLIPNYSATLFANVGLQVAHYTGGGLVPGYANLVYEDGANDNGQDGEGFLATARENADGGWDLEDHLGIWNATFVDSTGQALPNYIRLTVLPLFQPSGKLAQNYPGSAQQILQIGQLLGQVPSSLQLPFDVLFESPTFQVITSGANATDEQQVAATFFSQVDQLLAIMSINGLIKSPAQIATQVPTQQAVTSIFNGLLGSGGDGSASGYDAGTQQGVSGILQEIYNIGEAPAGSSLIGQNLSVVANAQRVGIDVILTVITSITNVYHDFSSQIQHNINHVENAQNAAMGTSAGLEAGSMAMGLLGMVTPTILGTTAIHPDGMADALGSASQLSVQIEQMVETQYMITANWQLSQQLMYLPLFTAVMIMMFVIGVTFALMIPLTPFILFFGGFIAWVLGTIEAMVAAPLLMLALAHPGGHEVWGYSTPGFRMLLGVVLRPVLMVVGVLVAMALTYILISLSASAFHVAAAALIGGTALDGVTQLPGMIPAGIDPNGYARGTIALLMIFVYAQFMIKAFNKCFSAIYIIPERVITWIGGQTDQVGAQDLQELSGSLTSSAQQMGQAGGQGLQSGIGGGQQKLGAVAGSHKESAAQGGSRTGVAAAGSTGVSRTNRARASDTINKNAASKMAGQGIADDTDPSKRPGG